MNTTGESCAEEVVRLRRCVNDLVDLTALPMRSAGGDLQQTTQTVLDAVLQMLGLAFALVRFKQAGDGHDDGLRTEVVSVAEPLKSYRRVPEPGPALNAVLGDAAPQWPAGAHITLEGAELCVAILPLGVEGEVGVLVCLG